MLSISFWHVSAEITFHFSIIFSQHSCIFFNGADYFVLSFSDASKDAHALWAFYNIIQFSQLFCETWLVQLANWIGLYYEMLTVSLGLRQASLVTDTPLHNFLTLGFGLRNVPNFQETSDNVLGLTCYWIISLTLQNKYVVLFYRLPHFC